MVGRTKISWSDEMMAILLNIKKDALIKQKQGDNRQLMKIIYGDWKQMYPQSKATLGSVKICLSKITRVGKNRNEHRSLDVYRHTDKHIVDDSREVEAGLGDVSKLSTGADSNLVGMTSPPPSIKEQEPQNSTEQFKDGLHLNKPPSHFNKRPASRPFKAKKKKSILNREQKEIVLSCYKTLMKSRPTAKISKHDIRRQVRSAWLQKNPTYSISLRTIAQIITSFNKNNIKCPSRFRRNLLQSPEFDGDFKHFSNIPDDSTRLKSMRKAAMHLSSQPIFKYICYNCGLLIPREFERAKLVAFDVNLSGLTRPPSLDMFESIGKLSYTNSKGIWTACNNCKKGPVDLYNACDPSTGKLYVPEALKDLLSPYEKGK